jgi:hypothetical protein
MLFISLNTPEFCSGRVSAVMAATIGCKMAAIFIAANAGVLTEAVDCAKAAGSTADFDRAWAATSTSVFGCAGATAVFDC